MYLDLGPENGGFPIDISEEGMAFQGIRPLQKDEEICIAIKLDGINEPVTAIARIVWLTESRKAGALQFVDLPEASRNHIRQWIELQRKAESPQHSAEMRISPGRPRPKPTQAPPVPVLAAVAVTSTAPAQTATIVEPAPAPSPAPVASAPSGPAGEPVQPVQPRIPPAVTKPQPEGQQSLPAQMAQVSKNHQPAPPMSVPLSPRRVKWAWSVSSGLALAACVGMAVVGAALLWPYRATIIERVHGNDAVKSVSPFMPTVSVPDLDQPVVQPPDDLPMTDPSQWMPLGSALASPATLSPADVSLKASTHSAREAASAAPVKSRKAPQTPAPPAKGLRPQAMPPTVEPVKSRQPAPSATAVVESASDSPASGAASAKPAVPETKAPAMPAATGSVEVISDPYPSIRMPAGSQGAGSRLGTSLQIGRLASKVEPAYSVEALRQKIAGTVKLHVVIGANGAVQSAEVMGGPALLADSARHAVEQWRYDPTMLGGTAIEVEEGVTLVFRIASAPTSAN
jgi:outer membrane biosynthesis protein TonB